METAYGSWKEDLLQVVQSATCEHQVFNTLASLARTMEFDLCAYGLCMPLPLTRPKTAVFNNYPADWQKVYQAKGYLCVDPTVQRARCTLSTVIWSNEIFAAAPDFWEEARSFGLVAGLAQPCLGLNGTGGLLTLARSAEAGSPAEWRGEGNTKTRHV